MKKCPKCGHDEFIRPRKVVQQILTDAFGNILRVTAACTEVIEDISEYDLCTCANCGYGARAYEFNIPESKGETNNA